MVVFRAQLEVDHHNADLTARDHKDDKDEKEESEKVIKLIFVNSRENEKEFDKTGSEW
jgi:hypothetical protein